MDAPATLICANPAGESKNTASYPPGTWPLDTPGGRYYAEWDDQAPVTRESQLIFFFQFLQAGGRWEEFLRECPLHSVKPLYGHQQGAQIGYNPQKPGRPSDVYHSYLIAQAVTRMSNELHRIRAITGRWSVDQRWTLLLTRLLRRWLGGKWLPGLPGEASLLLSG